jgi:hypothetical protein
LLISLQQRANTLLSEFRAFQAQLQASGLSKSVESRIFRRGVEAEAKSLETFARKQSITLPSGEGSDEAEIREAKQTHSLTSSNLPFYEAVWLAAKRCNGVRALGRRLYWENDGMSQARVSEPPRKQNKKHLNSAVVDIVADNGLEWIKISIVSAKRLLFEMAKEGWEDYGADPDEDGSSDEDNPHSKSEAKLDIVRLAEDLRDASRTTRIRYKHPQVKFILPSITEGEEDAIDAVLTQIRTTGAIVECGPPTILNGLSDLSLTPVSKFDHILPSPNHPTLTETINIDCTILLALISDISHVSRARLPPSPSNKSGIYHTAILKQIESEEHSPLLPHEVYPILKGRKLVCTALAAQRMREIVDIMATRTEAERARILLGEEECSGCEADLGVRWRGLSEHRLPEDILLPIMVEDFVFPDYELSAKGTSFQGPMANKLYGKMDLSSINASVFMYGWHHNIVTLTSNRVVAMGIERALNGILDELESPGLEISGKELDGADGFEGPKMYVCETARSLVGKEKGHGIRP